MPTRVFYCQALLLSRSNACAFFKALPRRKAAKRPVSYFEFLPDAAHRLYYHIKMFFYTIIISLLNFFITIIHFGSREAVHLLSSGRRKPEKPSQGSA